MIVEPPVIEQPRDDKGKFLPKRPLEFTREHFFLEIAEVTLAILLAQIITEGFLWLKSLAS